jgi:integrase
MARTSRGLTNKAIEAARHPGNTTRPVRFGHRDGLYLQIAAGGSKSWLFRFTLAGKSREMGLGSFGESGAGLTLAQARAEALAARALVKQGIDPILQRNSEIARVANQRELASSNTFENIAEAMVQSKETGWDNPKHRQQWRNTLKTYVYPIIGNMAVSGVGTDDVLRCLRPIWNSKPETASRVRGRIERVLSYAKALKLRDGENPAAWRGHLSEILPAPSRISGKERKHHPALPWQKISEFMTELCEKDVIAASALEFTILCASRTKEVLGARWGEIQLDEAYWLVPAVRMKAKREHKVALSHAALGLLHHMLPLSSGPDSFVFPGQRTGAGLSQMAMLMLLRRDSRSGKAITVHGFRSTFRDWCGEVSSHPTEVAEAALAHVIGNKTEAAYARGDLFTKRRRLMDDWALFCRQEPSEIRALNYNHVHQPDSSLMEG